MKKRGGTKHPTDLAALEASGLRFRTNYRRRKRELEIWLPRGVDAPEFLWPGTLTLHAAGRNVVAGAILYNPDGVAGGGFIRGGRDATAGKNEVFVTRSCFFRRRYDRVRPPDVADMRAARDALKAEPMPPLPWSRAA